ncbi:MAG: putative addiction module antidote protein [Candidatus Firestonebacteria bacterium]|nr:putative addiction module antidote protein [Candidatus Firestonebacteria bacterium]
MKAARDYKAGLLEDLKDPREAEAYLNAALEDGDSKAFLIALRDVAEAQGNMAALAKKCRVHRTSLYKMTSKQGNPSLDSVMKFIQCIGLHLKIAKMPSRITPR